DTGGREATLAIANIGTARLGAGTRVRLDATSAQQHRLHLEHGSMHAWVTAPPRLFAITTPSTAVTDLGCEYAIDVDAKGVGSITVISGKVELQAAAEGQIIVAPAGTHAAIRPGNRPGLPMVKASSMALAEAVAAYDRGDAGAVQAVLAAATETDAITLVNLAVVEPGNPHVLQRLGALAPSAAWTVDVAMTDPGAVVKWREEIVSAQIFIDSLIDR
ncbi:MAG: FecR domain-containing protein, partial [Deltaproteobacteria bacterium]|nr:FecR domain-containing protein [Deltaproteobacteria bacterium]